MKTYKVTVRAIVTKTYTIEASSEEQATEQAHEIFSVLNDDADEHYEQDVLDIKEAK